MNRAVMDIWVGIFVAIGIAATVFISIRVASLSTSTSGATYTLKADFDNIGGLKIRAPVKCSGVVVGRVKDIQLDLKRYLAVVTLELDSKYRFSEDASASILTAGLLGEQYIGLETGAETTMLKDGDTIIITSSAMILERLIGSFMLDKADK